MPESPGEGQETIYPYTRLDTMTELDSWLESKAGLWLNANHYNTSSQCLYSLFPFPLPLFSFLSLRESSAIEPKTKHKLRILLTPELWDVRPMPPYLEITPAKRCKEKSTWSSEHCVICTWWSPIAIHDTGTHQNGTERVCMFWGKSIHEETLPKIILPI